MSSIKLRGVALRETAAFHGRQQVDVIVKCAFMAGRIYFMLYGLLQPNARLESLGWDSVVDTLQAKLKIQA